MIVVQVGEKNVLVFIACWSRSELPRSGAFAVVVPVILLVVATEAADTAGRPSGVVGTIRHGCSFGSLVRVEEGETEVQWVYFGSMLFSELCAKGESAVKKLSLEEALYSVCDA